MDPITAPAPARTTSIVDEDATCKRRRSNEDTSSAMGSATSHAVSDSIDGDAAPHGSATLPQFPPPHFFGFHQPMHPPPSPLQQMGTSVVENKTIWVGDLHYWMDENFLGAVAQIRMGLLKQYTSFISTIARAFSLSSPNLTKPYPFD